jgi:hypothetical protein
MSELHRVSAFVPTIDFGGTLAGRDGRDLAPRRAPDLRHLAADRPVRRPEPRVVRNIPRRRSY